MDFKNFEKLKPTLLIILSAKMPTKMSKTNKITRMITGLSNGCKTVNNALIINEIKTFIASISLFF
ncbi:hypothetical protein FACS189432_03550 [Bacteroidia bacterium]|nr:hypothetical protein FACS189426_06850 [Bacteroidia bacterium]GHT27307.1 hypothetical protein FACS189432_03550 [Bacteroidia bacterium]